MTILFFATMAVLMIAVDKTLGVLAISGGTRAEVPEDI